MTPSKQHLEPLWLVSFPTKAHTAKSIHARATQTQMVRRRRIRGQRMTVGNWRADPRRVARPPTEVKPTDHLILARLGRQRQNSV